MTDTQKLYSLVIHAGAGAKEGFNYRAVEVHLATLTAEGEAMLKAGVKSLDVVEKMVMEMEASGYYVAGRGAAPNKIGQVELDASIMEGHTQEAGAVCAIKDAVHPISVARAVLSNTPYVTFVGSGAENFAKAEGFEFVKDTKNYYKVPIGCTEDEINSEEMLHGTVGAVALDRMGNLSAATSTGGVFGKPEGRVGDTPMIGLGTWADSDIAISCTGTGEYFVRSGGALFVANIYKLSDDSLEEACQRMLDEVKRLGGNGGIIAISKKGEIVTLYNSEGMKQAYVSEGENVTSKTFN
ncbi:MAG: isoaspartyl peptidase/L-asparaginase family protein [Sphingomonadales bacterium]